MERVWCCCRPVLDFFAFVYFCLDRKIIPFFRMKLLPFILWLWACWLWLFSCNDFELIRTWGKLAFCCTLLPLTLLVVLLDLSFFFFWFFELWYFFYTCCLLLASCFITFRLCTGFGTFCTFSFSWSMLACWFCNWLTLLSLRPYLLY